MGDVNGDRRADLVCKDPGRVWVDYAGDDFYAGTDYFLDTTWCTHEGALTFVGDENLDGRADLVCRGSEGFVWIDHADPLGQYGVTDDLGLGPDFELLDIARPLFPFYFHGVQIRNNGSAGTVTSIHCSTSPLPLILDPPQFLPQGGTTSFLFSSDHDHAVVTCSVVGRATDGSRELFISNNALTKRMR